MMSNDKRPESSVGLELHEMILASRRSAVPAMTCIIGALALNMLILLVGINEHVNTDAQHGQGVQGSSSYLAMNDVQTGRSIRISNNPRVSSSSYISKVVQGSPIDTVETAIAIEDGSRGFNFPPSLYTASFLADKKKAEEIGGAEAETILIGEYTGPVTILSTRLVENKVLAKVTAKDSHTGKQLTKTITFFLAPDGKIDDVDTNTPNYGANGERTGGMQPTIHENYRSIIGGR